jgi:hypothetical protein
MSTTSVPESDPIDVFILSAPEDEAYRRQFERHLGPLQREGAITLWHPGLVTAGDDVRATTLDRMRAARVFLLLVSSDYESGCWDDQERIFSRRLVGVRIVPIIVRHFDWQRGPLGKLRPLPYNGRPVAQWDDKDAAWQENAGGVRQVVDEERRQPATAPTPFQDDPELASAWRAGAEAAWAEVDEILKRSKERRLEAEQKRGRSNFVIGFVAWAIWLGFFLLLWWEGGTVPTSLLYILLLILILWFGEEMKQRRRRRANLSASTRTLSKK